MLYENYKDNIVYNSQSIINFPKNKESEKPGNGVMIFLMCPNRQKAIEVVEDPAMGFKKNQIKRFMTDTVFKEKIGSKRVISLEKSKADKFYLQQDNFSLHYINTGMKKKVLNDKKNCVYDLSRLMEIIFSRINGLNPNRKCSEFIRLLKNKINSQEFSEYEKILVFDINSWTPSVKSCVVMNKKLLNNPISILLYSACYYPELMNEFPDIRIAFVNRSSKQVYFIKSSFITRKNYGKIKTKLRSFKDIVFSVEDDFDDQASARMITENIPNNKEEDKNSTDETVINEVQAEIISTFKEEIKNNITYNLLGNSKKPNPFDDITDELADPISTINITNFSDNDDEVFSLSNLEENPEEISEEDEETQISDSFNITDEVSKEVENIFEDIDDIDDIDPVEIAENVADKIKTTKFKASFIPERTPEQLAKIERLTKDQKEVLYTPTIDDVKRKSIKSVTTGGYIKTSNHNILESKFANFDKDYTEKSLQKNIDDAVGALANASDKIFVTGKSIVDSSDSQNLKEEYTYNLIDEKGNRMTISFDVPKVIDGTYIFINGTKKCIRHQLILKPIVKTSPDTVQIVTAYNKVFIRRQGLVNQNMNRIQVFIDKNKSKFKARVGNCSMLNGKYDVPLDYAMLSRYYSEFTIGDVTYYLSIDSLLDKYKNLNGDKKPKYDPLHEIPIGINNVTKEVVALNLEDSYLDTLLNSFPESDRKQISAIKRKPRLVMACAKIMKQNIPLVLFMLFCEGFASVMKKANIEYKFVPKSSKEKYDTINYDSIQLNDGYIIWKKVPFRNELLMNGLKKCDLSDYTYDDLEDRNTYDSLLMNFYPGNYKISYAFENYRDFLLDAKTKEILLDLGYPDDLVSLLIVATGMLTDTRFIIENNLNNMRVRSSEVIADLIYITVTKAYNKYRNTAYKSKPTKISFKKSAIIDSLLDSDTNMIEESSVLNPILEIEKQRSVTFKGIRGIQMDRAMTLPRRCYDQSMLGTLAISTSPDANVGVVRSLTLEPQITSTYGYIDTSKTNNLDELNAANLFNASELLQPLGVIHDDPDRSSMNMKYSKYLVPIESADPVMIGNKVESIVPYITTDEFVVNAKESGKVIERTKDFCIVEYKSGTKYAIDISNRVRKNASAGFWIDNTLKCDLKVGDKFEQGDILAYNDKHYSKNHDDRGVSFNLGALCKLAVTSEWDIYEDSAPISKRLSEKLSTEMIDEKHINLSQFTHVDYMVKVGDKINAGDPLISFLSATSEEDFNLLKSMQAETKDIIIDSAKSTVHSKYTGEIADIKIYTSVDPEELEPSLAKIVKDYWNRIEKRNKLLRKNRNEGDLNFYCAGQVINEIAEVVSLTKNNKIQGYEMLEGEVLILFYIKYRVEASKGDKAVAFSCKGVISHVFPEGMEPYSEYRPDEVIDTIVAPLAISARKVPNIFITMFGNKLMIELKRQIKDIYLG